MITNDLYEVLLCQHQGPFSLQEIMLEARLETGPGTAGSGLGLTKQDSAAERPQEPGFEIIGAPVCSTSGTSPGTSPGSATGQGRTAAGTATAPRESQTHQEAFLC